MNAGINQTIMEVRVRMYRDALHDDIRKLFDTWEHGQTVPQLHAAWRLQDLVDRYVSSLEVLCNATGGNANKEREQFTHDFYSKPRFSRGAK